MESVVRAGPPVVNEYNNSDTLEGKNMSMIRGNK